MPAITAIIPAADHTAAHYQDNLDRDLDSITSVDVLKDILPGHTIKVKGNLVVRGNIRGSDILVTKDLTVIGGIFGEPKRKITVHGKIYAGQISDAAIECNRGIEVVDSITNATLKARESIVVGETIVGGEVLSMSSIGAKRIGSDQAIETRVGAGVDFRLKVMFDEMHAEINEISLKAEKIRLGISTLENKEKTHYGGISFQEKILIKNSRASLDKLEKQLEGLNERKNKLEKKIETVNNAFVEVEDKIFPNTTLSIQNRLVAAQKEYPAGRYIIKNEKIFRLQENR